MVISLALALLLQVSDPTTPRTDPVCTLVTPSGEKVGFHVLSWDGSGDQVGLVRAPGSVWPSRTLVGARSILARPPAGKIWFGFGQDDGLVLELSPGDLTSARHVATLMRRQDRRSGVPLAYGYCEQGQSPTVYPAVDVSTNWTDIDDRIAAFDPRRWPADRCSMLLSDGRRLPLRFFHTGPDRVEIAAPPLWDGRPVTARVARRGGRGLGASFSRRNGPNGVQELITSERLGASLIRFSELGDRSVSGQTAYAICGYTSIVRRPAA